MSVAQAPETSVTNTPANAPSTGMIWVPGGTFRMGSDRHYGRSARPSRDCRRFLDRPLAGYQSPIQGIVRATGHVTFAEIAPDANELPMEQRDFLELAIGNRIAVDPEIADG